MNRSYLTNDFDKADYDIARSLKTVLMHKPYTHAITFSMEKRLDEQSLRRSSSDDVAAAAREVRIFANRLHRRANARRRERGLESAEVELFAAPEVTTRTTHELCPPHFHCIFQLDDVLDEEDLRNVVAYIHDHSFREYGFPINTKYEVLYDKAEWLRYCLKNTHIDNFKLEFIYRGRETANWKL